MPAWIHDRAMKLKKQMEDTYPPEKAKQVAFAIATQQAHKTGKSPKTFGTSEGRSEAMAKFDKPKSEYKKTAMDKLALDLIGGAIGGLVYGSVSPTTSEERSMGRHAWEGAKGGAVAGFIPPFFLGPIGGYLHARKKDTGQGYIESRGDFLKRLKEEEKSKTAAIMFDGFADELEKIAISFVAPH